MDTSHSASSSMTGYLFQARYALLRGLEEGRHNTDCAISIERFDDVAFEDAAGPVELIQTKHHGRPGNTSDNSVDVWTTLRAWINRIAGNPTTAIDTRFVLLTTDTAADGSALAKLRDANKDRDISGAVDLLLSAAANSKNHSTEIGRNAFLNLAPTMRETLVRNIWVFDNAPNIIDVRDDIETVLYYSAPHGKVGVFTDYFEGWWFNRVINSLAVPHSGAIPLLDIQNKVYELQQDFQSNRLPLDEAIDAMPPVTMMPEDDRIFVRQMKMISVREAEALIAIHDYYRAFAQRSRWVRENLFLDGEENRYDRALWDEWRRRFIPSANNDNDELDDSSKQKIGRNIFRWACQYSKPLRNRGETWLSSGSFQMLADLIRIGWHPDYQSLLKREEGKI